MASIHKIKGSANWHAFFYLPDGRRTHRSTGTQDKKKAWAVCLKYEATSDLAKKKRLSEAVARRTIADLYHMNSPERLQSDSTRDYIAAFLKRKELELAESSLAEYRLTGDLLFEHLGSKADNPMDSVERQDAIRFRDVLAKRVSGATVNKRVKIARAIWAAAHRDGIVQDNPFGKVERLKVARSIRRGFTLPELKRLLAVCDDDWRGLVLAGLYTGQRISDISTLTWAQVDLEQNEIHFCTRKTERDVHIPIAEPLRKYLLTRAGVDDPVAPVFPSAVGEGSNTLARRFGDIMAAAGLAVKRTHQSTKHGRSARRETSALSFHCLRHTATSLLKNAGVSDVVAREIIGHDSEAVSRQYTHIDTSTLRTAVDKMPDVTKG
jgi:integrase